MSDLAEQSRNSAAPSDIESRELMQAAEYLMRREVPAALAKIDTILRGNRSSSGAWYMLGRAMKDQGDLQGAIACYRRALALDRRNPAILTSLGTVLAAVNQPERAAVHYERALAIDPSHKGAQMSLDVLRPRRAVSTSGRRLPDLAAGAQSALAAGRGPEALACHREALELAPLDANLWATIGLLMVELGSHQSALTYLEEAIRLNPRLTVAIDAARALYINKGLPDKAAALYRGQTTARASTEDREIALGLSVPAIVESVAQIASCRQAYDASLDRFIASGSRIQDVWIGHVPSAFFLAYHGENNAPLHAKLARFLRGAIENLAMEAPHCGRASRRPGRVRIGFLSAALRDHSIGKTTLGLLAQLRRDLFEVWALRVTPSARDAMTDRILSSADHALELHVDFRHAREQIANLELDVLFFQDIGMDAATYRIASSRLAPVQCVSYGHPDTTGLREMDYFISNDWYEPEDAVSHYTEKLFLLRSLPTLAYYYRPEIPSPAPRSSFGLHESDHVYLCPQALFKVHPDQDAAFKEILLRDPDAVVVLIRSGFDAWTERLQARLDRSLGPHSSRVHWIDQMDYTRYLQLLLAADVGLDTWHFNGMNTSLEALGMGLPVVTLPGGFQRGRHTQAMYRSMGIEDCIADDKLDYVEIALRIGQNPEFAGSLRQRIRASNGVLFENPRVLSEFERFFIEATRAARPEWSWPVGAADLTTNVEQPVSGAQSAASRTPFL